jgi:hypothetical protein
VFIVEVLHQPIHVAEVAGATSIPSANGDLIGALSAVVFFLIGAKERKDAGGVRDLARAIGGN